MSFKSLNAVIQIVYVLAWGGGKEEQEQEQEE